MIAGFLVLCANADVEAVSGEASLDTVNPVTDSQVWQGILVVCVGIAVCDADEFWS